MCKQKCDSLEEKILLLKDAAWLYEEENKLEHFSNDQTLHDTYNFKFRGKNVLFFWTDVSKERPTQSGISHTLYLMATTHCNGLYCKLIPNHSLIAVKRVPPCIHPRGFLARLSTLRPLVASSPASCGAAGQLAESRWSLCPRHCGATGPLWGNRAGAHSSGIMGGMDKKHTSSHNEKSNAHTHMHI